ncbi:MAG: hypothetical protein RSG50_11105, partial [Clostridia bacterium]
FLSRDKADEAEEGEAATKPARKRFSLFSAPMASEDEDDEDDDIAPSGGGIKLFGRSRARDEDEYDDEYDEDDEDDEAAQTGDASVGYGLTQQLAQAIDEGTPSRRARRAAPPEAPVEIPSRKRHATRKPAVVMVDEDEEEEVAPRRSARRDEVPEVDEAPYRRARKDEVPEEDASPYRRARKDEVPEEDASPYRRSARRDEDDDEGDEGDRARHHWLGRDRKPPVRLMDEDDEDEAFRVPARDMTDEPTRAFRPVDRPSAKADEQLTRRFQAVKRTRPVQDDPDDLDDADYADYEEDEDDADIMPVRRYGGRRRGTMRVYGDDESRDDDEDEEDSVYDEDEDEYDYDEEAPGIGKRVLHFLRGLLVVLLLVLLAVIAFRQLEANGNLSLDGLRTSVGRIVNLDGLFPPPQAKSALAPLLTPTQSALPTQTDMPAQTGALSAMGDAAETGLPTSAPAAGIGIALPDPSSNPAPTQIPTEMPAEAPTTQAPTAAPSPEASASAEFVNLGD